MAKRVVHRVESIERLRGLRSRAPSESLELLVSDPQLPAADEGHCWPSPATGRG